jgi:iron complex transport system substrate-binding protein
VRIASLLPSATEIVYALGLGEQLVAVTYECDMPPAARTDHHVVVSGADTATMTPAQIDAHVRASADAGADLYTLDAGAMAGLAPDLILTQDLCRVCAVPAGQVTQALAHLGCTADVLTLDPHTLDDVLGTILAVGSRTGRQQEAEQVVSALRDRLQAVAAQVQGRPRPRVAVLEWIDPPFSAGHWVPDLVRAAGGEPVARQPGSRSQVISWDDVHAARPDVIVVAPCGFHLPAAIQQAGSVLAHLPAVPVWAMDADGLVVRPGPRLVDGVEALAAVLHPDVFDPPEPTAVRRVDSE